MELPDGPLFALLDRLEIEGASHDAQQQEHHLKRLNLERDTARLIQFFLLASSRRQVLEVGTSNGYSGLWIADALRRIRGAQPLLSIERDPAKAEQAQANFVRAGLAEWVNILVGDATEIIARLPGPFDAVFFDADRVSAPGQLALLLPRLEANALLLADNVSSHPQEIAGYLEMVRQLPGFTSVTISVGKGLHVAHRQQAEK